MSLSPINAHCEKCNLNFTGTPQRSFLGFQKVKCSSCNEVLTYPLTTGYRITYWVLSVIMVLAFINALSQGVIGVPGFLGIATIIALVRDRSLKKKTLEISATLDKDQVASND